jgi:hypothetical protein
MVEGFLMFGGASKILNGKNPPADFSTSCKVLGDVGGQGGGCLALEYYP